MKRLLHLLVALLGLAALAPVGAAQQHAKGTLYTRVQGDDVFAVAVIRIDLDWYLYHTDLGHPDAIGVPTTFAFSGADVEWSEVVMKDPKIKQANPLLGDYTYAVHVGRTYAYAKGKRAPGADLSGLKLEIVGQTCDPSLCTDYEETLESSGEGAERYWEGWPAALGAGPLAAAAPVEGVVTEGGDAGETPNGEEAVPLGPPVSVPGGDPLSTGDEPTGDTVTGQVFVVVDEETGVATAAVVLEVAEGFHIYHGPTDADLGHEEAAAFPTTIHLSGGGVEWSTDVQYPPAEKHDDGYAAADGSPVWSWIHEGTVRFLVEGVEIDEFDPENDFVARVEGQVCDANGCLPFELQLPYGGEGEPALFAALPAFDAQAAGGSSAGAAAGGPGEGSAGGSVVVDDAPPPQKPLWQYLLLAVMWGLVTLLMPCTYPMIPITISFFTKQAMNRDGKVLPLSAAYGIGIVLMFIVLGAVLGGPVQFFANHWITQLVIGALFLFFALVLWGVINLQPPQALMQMAGKASQKGGLAGVFLMGATLVITSFSCTAPFVGDIIARGATQGWTRPILGMGVFGLTMAIPFVALSLFPAKLQQMPSAGEWMHVLKVSLGFVEFAAAFKFISGADLVLNKGMLPDELFLVIWAGAFLGLAIFLFGWIHIEGETQHPISPGRMASAVVSLIFSVYLGAYGLLGFQMDPIMTSILPGYRAERAADWGGGGGGGAVKERVLVKDDLDAAVAAARAQDKLLLVNFTGFN